MSDENNKDSSSEEIPDAQAPQDVVAQVRAQLDEISVSPGQSIEAVEKVQMQETRISRSPWIVRGLITILLVLLVGEIFWMQQANRQVDDSFDMSRFESGPTVELLDTPAPDMKLIEAPPDQVIEEPLSELLPEPQVDILPEPQDDILPEPPTPTPLPTP